MECVLHGGAVEWSDIEVGHCEEIQQNSVSQAKKLLPSTLIHFTMVRVSRTARGIQRALKMINKELSICSATDADPYLDRDITCPHCNRPVETTTGCTRHIMMKPECRAKHIRALGDAQRMQKEQSYKVAGLSSRLHPGTGQSGSANEPSGGAEARYNDPWCWYDNGRTCGAPFVEECPISTAGQPISKQRAYQEDLGTYLKSCGTLSNPTYMEVAELLTTTGLSGKGRTRHLKSSFVSVCLSN
jgi:hypothetical protein